ncbi:MAG: ROK family transcriptional regulator [Acidobacteria bacterium]|nr:MAG: ROK family transcriptional regulator [Acidobacteriota bacterium]REJ98685.1 MAG: ROK family transcriptional regulator [Acidobacteriota bacterium]REK16659.1 MAG: ROK family transcriptional regulator [Acidobacteriota bacterium]REK42570.1 MAG: ROK family transcriptional regulator [Acidobacteriota bacterium]
MIRRLNLKKANVARSNTIRDYNRQIVLNYIREEGPISRADIARATALQRSTVSLIVDELSKHGLVQEVYGESSGGRPPRLLSLKTAGAIALGIDLGEKRISIGACDLSGRVSDHEDFPTSKDHRKTLSRIIEVSRKYIDKHGGSIEGIGLSVPGLVESWDGGVIMIPHLDWKETDISRLLTEATGLPVRIENDANAAAFAELWLGRPEISNVSHLVAFLIQEGIGTGIVFDGQIYRGKDGTAGEFGHMTIGSGAPSLCSAGDNSCWEAFASETACRARYSNFSGSKSGNTSFAEIIDLALDGDEKALKALKDTAQYIGLGIANVVQGLSPELSIVAGEIVRAWPLVGDEIVNAAESAVCQDHPKVNVIPSTLGPRPTFKGALSLVLADKFASVSLS